MRDNRKKGEDKYNLNKDKEKLNKNKEMIKIKTQERKRSQHLNFPFKKKTMMKKLK